MRLFILILFLPGWLMAQPKSYDQRINTITFRMIGIAGGKFQLGSTQPPADPDEAPVKEIVISPFWIGEHEVTFLEWDQYFNDASLPQTKNIDGITRATPQYIDLTWGMGREATHPVNSLSQQAAMMYCRWLYAKTGLFYRLPTEAEWEYACKAGGKGSSAISLDVMAYYETNSDARFHPVKEKKANAWGIYDMLGNLSEWTVDQYDPQYYSKIKASNPITEPGARYPRTLRGGSFLDDAAQLRCSNRIPSEAGWNKRDPQIPKSRWWLTDGMFVGFRLVRPAEQPSKEEIEAFYTRYLK
jgi:formylglycine-generating enzyme required for sulfatase activity